MLISSKKPIFHPIPSKLQQFKNNFYDKNIHIPSYLPKPIPPIYLNNRLDNDNNSNKSKLKIIIKPLPAI